MTLAQSRQEILSSGYESVCHLDQMYFAVGKGVHFGVYCSIEEGLVLPVEFDSIEIIGETSDIKVCKGGTRYGVYSLTQAKYLAQWGSGEPLL